MATSSTQSGFVDSWQRGKSVIECNLHMLETEDFTDVTFLVGSEKHVVRAHRYVLASRSCVFHAMFCGRMAEQNEITLPDIEASDFRDFLRFLYTDNVSINSKNVTGLMYSSRKYDVETLFTQSASFLNKTLSERNLCEILEKSHGYGETGLERKALEMLRKASRMVTNSAKFVDLCPNCVAIFLKSEKLKLEEEEVFEAALSWTKAECEREGLSPSHENMRKVLGEMVYEIRFASLSLEFLTNVVGPSGILSDSERIRIMDKKVNTNVDISPFKSKVGTHNSTRRSTDDRVHLVNRFHSCGEGDCYAGPHVIAFSTDMTIQLLGCQLYGSSREHRTILDIELYDDQSNLISTPVQNTDWTLSDTVNDIMFSDPISIYAGRLYIISVNLSSGTNIAGFGGRIQVSESDVKFTFGNQHQFLSFSSVEKGQIPALIWRLD